MPTRWVFAIFFLFILLGMQFPSWADGFMVPVMHEHPRFNVKFHRVNVKIDNQVATTNIDQAFHSNASRPIEGTYIFPIADGMTITKFTMRDNNEDLPHRVLDKEEARRIYNGIVQQQRDPALLEWLGTRMIKASVFPIQPGEDKRIRIGYQEVLQAQAGLIKYVYPLKTEKLSSRPLEDCRVEIAIRSAQPIRNIYSPTHNISVKRNGDHEAVVEYAENNVLPDQDLVLYYTVSESMLGMNLLTYRDSEKGDGYFLLLASPKSDISEDEKQPKDVVFVLDTSGSMSADDKLKQAKEALKFCLHSLDERDRFGLIAFNDEIRPWQTNLQRATDEHIKAADKFLADFRAESNTDINGALLRALDMLNEAKSDDERPRSIVFLTDGLPTEGETNVERILDNVKANNKKKVRIFDFGVGYDYNAHFLDKLANESKGFAENVLPNENLEGKISSLYAKVSTPLLMNLSLDWGGVEVDDQYPNELPDIFKGSQLLIVGRYEPRENGEKTVVKLNGSISGHKKTISATFDFPAWSVRDDFIPRLWATRKIGYLEDQLRLNGTRKETVEEIIRLSKEYGILTEYTSFLVDMDENAPGGPIPNALRGDTGAVVGEAMNRINIYGTRQSDSSAVSQSINRKSNMYSAQIGSGQSSIIINERGEKVQFTQVRNISQRSFVQNGDQWVDMNATPTQKIINVKAFSPAYFQLANSHPRMAQFMSISGNVRVALKEVAIQVGADGQEAEFKPDEFNTMISEINSEFGKP